LVQTNAAGPQELLTAAGIEINGDSIDVAPADWRKVREPYANREANTGF